MIAANVMVALFIVGIASAYGYVQWRLSQIHRENLTSLSGGPSAGGGAAGAPFTLLIVGSDSRSALAKNSDNSQFGGSAITPGQRSDTIILARVSPATRQIMLMSVPRDLWVNIPGHGMNRINSAFDTGADLLVQTIQNDLGIPVNHYVEVNFDTFRAVTNAVGGVSFYFPTPAKDSFSLLKVQKAGCNNLSGDQALGFVRSRHYEYYENGYWHFEQASDLARIQRQQAFIKKMIKKAEGQYTDPFALNSVIASLTKNLTVDSSFGSNLILSLAKDFRSIDASAIPNLTLPNYPFTTSDGSAVLGLQQPQAKETVAAFNAFGAAAPAAPATTAPPATEHPVTTAPAPAVTVAPGSVTIEVVNGSGKGGQATDIQNFLNQKGYKAYVNDQSPGYGHAATEVRYAPDAANAARQVAALIPGGASTVADPALTPTAYNLEVVTGTSYVPTGAPAPAATTDTSAAGTTTTLPGTNTKTYTLPGLAAGQSPPAC